MPLLHHFSPRRVKGSVRFFSPEEMRRILEHAGERRDFYEFLYWTLARAFSEGRTFRRGQVDFDRGVVVFEEATSKARRREEIELPAAIRPMLERRCSGLKAEDCVFPAEAAMAKSNLGQQFKSLLRRLGLQGSLHTIRHTGISHLVMPPDPVPLRIVMSLARHKDLKTTLRYAHLSPEQVTGAGFINCRKL